ncbi:hypothetical protein L1987_71788 [Smallanthus sonchifolius]|uniref:Uncharacterized protein n=1 Tax=Smallanthus sonchifolius TaxID=185202 RepID=A0ACB9AXR2_9ASTR|nr:hypothetical protein L1987_71788 [Smallanthus sonchifolius]
MWEKEESPLATWCLFLASRLEWYDTNVLCSCLGGGVASWLKKELDTHTHARAHMFSISCSHHHLILTTHNSLTEKPLLISVTFLIKLQSLPLFRPFSKNLELGFSFTHLGHR